MSRELNEELKKIETANGGILRPPDVVKAAQKKTSPLHGKFTWDDGEAAKQHRLWQAREIIRVHVVVLDGSREPVQAYVSLHTDRKQAGGGYRSIEAVLLNPSQRDELLRMAMADLATFRRKYNVLKALAGVFAAADRVSA